MTLKSERLFGPVVVRADGLVLREWVQADVPVMVEMFNTTEMDRWTPLAHPFGPEAAAEYVHAAHRGKSSSALQLAITTDGATPLGEVLLFPTSTPETCEFAYAVGREHRGQALAARAVMALFPFARDMGYRIATLTVAEDNVGSQCVARAARFKPLTGPPQRRERKGYVLHMGSWARHV